MAAIDVNVNVVGLDKMQEALSEVDLCIKKLHESLIELHEAVRNIGLDISQPPAGTDG